MDRGDTVRGTDTTVHGARTDVRASVPFQRFLKSLRDSNELDPNEALSASLPTRVRRKAGAFFTNASLAEALAKPFAEDLKGDATVMDPACGAGDLLLAAAKHFKHARDPERRLEEWEERIFGRDLFEEFVLSARLRMFRASLARSRAPDLHNLFLGIQRGCSLTSVDAYTAATHILINPPYTLVRAPDGCEWRTGRVSAAALFMEALAKNATAGTRIGAVLPDVLRSGSGYDKWRSMMGRLLDINSVQIVGRFARWADVDVFLLHGRVRSSSRRATSTWPTAPARVDRLAEHCGISVGPLVDYRSPKLGPWFPYVSVDNAPAWSHVNASTLGCRRFTGRTERTPFIVVRRTSRAGDAHRMVACIVTGQRRVAVENHLLILTPKTRTVAECEAIVARLRDPRTTAWLNERIRLRHLTIGAVGDLPWWNAEAKQHADGEAPL